MSARQGGDIASCMQKKKTYDFVYDYRYPSINIFTWIIKNDWLICLANISLQKTPEVLHQQIEPDCSGKVFAETLASNPSTQYIDKTLVQFLPRHKLESSYIFIYFHQFVSFSLKDTNQNPDSNLHSYEIFVFFTTSRSVHEIYRSGLYDRLITKRADKLMVGGAGWWMHC